MLKLLITLFTPFLFSVAISAQTFSADSLRFYSFVDSIRSELVPFKAKNKRWIITFADGRMTDKELNVLAAMFAEKKLYGSEMHCYLKRAMREEQMDSVYYYAGQTVENMLRYEPADANLLIPNIQADLIYWYVNNGYFELAIRKVAEMKQFVVQNNIPEHLPSVQQLLSGIYMMMDRPRESIKIAIEGLDMFPKEIDVDLWIDKGSLYDQIIQCSTQIGDYKQSRYYCNQLLAWVELFPQNESLLNVSGTHYQNCYSGEAYAYLSISYSESGDTLSAKEMMQKAEYYFNEINSRTYWRAIPGIKNVMYLCYYTSTGDYNKALAIIDDVLSVTGSKEKEPVNYKIKLKIKADIYEKMGEYKQAAEIRTEVLQLTDSLNREDMNKEINSLWTVFEVDKARMKKQQSDMKVQQLYIICVGGAIIILLVFIILIRQKINIKKLNEKNRILFEQQQKNVFTIPHLVTDNNSDTTGNLSLYDRIIEYLLSEHRYTDSAISREAVAVELGTNRQYIADAIHENMHMTFSDLINNLRLDYARQLLLNSSSLSIKDIIYQSGFRNRTTFSRLFREKYGMTPTEFKVCADEKETTEE